MSKSTRYALCLLSTLTLAVPASALAQAVPRGSAPEPSSPAPSSSGSSSSGSSSSGSPSSGSATPSGTPDYSPPPPQVRVPPPPSRTPPPDAAKTGSAVRRGETASGGDSGSGVARPGGSTNSTNSSGSNNAVLNPGDPRSRNRDGRQVTGVASQRDLNNLGGGLSTSLFAPWGRWSPWYSSNLGYVSYNPWIFGGTRWNWYRSGYYSPYGYNPYGMYGYYDPWYDPWYDGGGYYPSSSSGGYNSSSRGSERETSGSLRLRVKPSHAKVYLDGTLIGTVDEFDGLGNHLATEAGTHQLELRADGYESFKTTVKVEAGKTITARASMKKK